MMNVLNNWNSDSTEIPKFHYDSLCHFNHQVEKQKEIKRNNFSLILLFFFLVIFSYYFFLLFFLLFFPVIFPLQNASDLEKANIYRKAEVPFVVYNIPEVDEVVKKWNSIDYLNKKLGRKTYRTETSKDNHFMYWHAGLSFKLPNGKKWEPPTGLVQVTFENWLETAVKGQNKTLDDRTHQYFRVSSDMNNDWLFDELPFFKPKRSLMIVEPREQRGIHCRFGMRNVIAEAHFDGSRNSVVMLGGLRRWILAHPNQCKFFILYNFK